MGPTSGKVLPDTRVFVEFVFSTLRESIDFPRAAFLLLVARSQMLITDQPSQRCLLEGSEISEVRQGIKETNLEGNSKTKESCSWFLKYSCLKKKKREGKRERLVAEEISKERVRYRGKVEERRKRGESRRVWLCADWSASSSPSRAAFQSKLILTIPVAFFDLRQCGGREEVHAQWRRGQRGRKGGRPALLFSARLRNTRTSRYLVILIDIFSAPLLFLTTV